MMIKKIGVWTIYKKYIYIQILLLMAQLEQIATLLMKTTQGNTQSIREAEKKLEKESRNQNFLNILLSIPSIEGASPLLSKIATVYTLTYVRNLVNLKDQAYINIAAEKLVQFIGNNKIQFKYKDQVGAALYYLIMKDHHNIITNAYMLNIIGLLQNSIQSPSNEINYQFLTILCEVMADKSVPAGGPNAEPYIKGSFVCLSVLIKKLLQLAITSEGTDESVLQKAMTLATKMLKVMKKQIKKFMYFSISLTQTLFSQQFYELITYLLRFNLPQNQISIPFFYFNPRCSAAKLIQLFHLAKSLTVYILSQSLRIIISSSQKLIKNSLQQSQILKQCPELIDASVKSIENLLQKIPYAKIKSKLMFKIIQEIYNFLVLALRSCRFYNILNEIKPTLLYTCIFKTLAFTYQDYQNYYNDPEQFVNSMLHIIDVDVGFLLANDNPEMDQSDVDIQIFDTLKTNAANLLKVYVKYIDGTLAQIYYYITNVLDDKINIEFSKILLMLILCVLRDEFKIRNDFMSKIKKVVFKNLAQLQIPTKKVEEPYNVQYSMNFIIISKYLILFADIDDNINTLETVYTILQALLKNPTVEEVPKIIAADVMTMFLKTEEGSLYCRRIITLLNDVMSAKKINIKHLQCIQNILKENDYVFKNDYLVLIEMSEKISAFLQGELKKSQKNVQVMTKLWHIFEQMIVSKQLGVLMADTMRRVLQPLVNMINGQNELELEQKVYSLMQKIIKATGAVGQFQIQIFGILPKTFYVGKNKMRFSSSFSLIQLILLNGREEISSNIIIIQNLILLCIENINATTVNSSSRPQTDYLEGVLTLQSIIISVGSVLTRQIWVAITHCLTNKILKTLIVYDFIKQSIISTLCIILGASSNFFSLSDKEQFLKLVFKQFHYLSHNQPTKIFIIAASNLLKNFNQPFISKFTQILDCTITLLKNSSAPKSTNKFTQLEQQVSQFQKISAMVVTCYSNIDQFQYFKSTIEEIKMGNQGLLQNAYNELPETKKSYLRDLLHMRKINDQARIIYRVKNKQKQMQM